MKLSGNIVVAGGGIAGTLLSRFLVLEGFKVTLYLDDLPAASHVAAGILHPVTGRRLVKSWMADTFIPFAELSYRSCESDTGQSFFRNETIVELLRDASEYNRWMEAASDPGMSEYISSPAPISNPSIQPFSYAAHVKGGVLQTGRFLEAMHGWLETKCAVVHSAFDSNEFFRDIENHKTETVIFCEGYKSILNPFWKNLPWLPSKGELLTIRCPGLDEKNILNRNVFILHLEKDLYRVGSTYSWDELNDLPTEAAREKLAAAAAKILKRPFEIINQEAAVRPTVKERRPFLGFHPIYDNVGIFNGLGTKGAMSSPWLAHHLVQHLKHGQELHPETDVQRFRQLLEKQYA